MDGSDVIVGQVEVSAERLGGPTTENLNSAIRDSDGSERAGATRTEAVGGEKTRRQEREGG